MNDGLYDDLDHSITPGCILIKCCISDRFINDLMFKSETVLPRRTASFISASAPKRHLLMKPSNGCRDYDSNNDGQATLLLSDREDVGVDGWVKKILDFSTGVWEPTVHFPFPTNSQLCFSFKG